MKIGIIGSGRIGGTLAQLFAGAGHQVAMSNSRGPESLRFLTSSLGPNVRPGHSVVRIPTSSRCRSKSAGS